jgi:ABC-type transport system involved in cytochrome bd biosynthesis fused ATPase/permease subunit
VSSLAANTLRQAYCQVSYYNSFLLQFITRCDEVYLMSNGKIVESGTHEGLMETSPEYSSLIKNCAHDNAKKYFV